MSAKTIFRIDDLPWADAVWMQDYGRLQIVSRDGEKGTTICRAADGDRVDIQDAALDERYLYSEHGQVLKRKYQPIFTILAKISMKIELSGRLLDVEAGGAVAREHTGNLKVLSKKEFRDYLPVASVGVVDMPLYPFPNHHQWPYESQF
jgi:hypothetical protein